MPTGSGLPRGPAGTPDYDVDALGGGLERMVELIRTRGFNGV
jgi:hypothetical protein